MPIPARLLYDGYPHSDLLPIKPPRKGQSLHSWHKKAIDTPFHHGDQLGDTLFLFLVRELGEPNLGLIEAISRLQRARDDIVAVLDRFEELRATLSISKSTTPPPKRGRRAGREVR